MLNKLEVEIVDILLEQAEEAEAKKKPVKPDKAEKAEGPDEDAVYAEALNFVATETEKNQQSGLNALGLIFQVTKLANDKYGQIGDRAMLDTLKKSLSHDEVKKDKSLETALTAIVDLAEKRGYETSSEPVQEDLAGVMKGVAEFAKTTGADIISRHIPRDPAVYGIMLGVVGAFVGLPSLLVAPIIWASAVGLYKRATGERKIASAKEAEKKKKGTESKQQAPAQSASATAPATAPTVEKSPGAEKSGEEKGGKGNDIAYDIKAFRNLTDRYVAPSEYKARSQHYKESIEKNKKSNPQKASQYQNLSAQLDKFYNAQRQKIGARLAMRMKAHKQLATA